LPSVRWNTLGKQKTLGIFTVSGSDTMLDETFTYLVLSTYTAIIQLIATLKFKAISFFYGTCAAHVAASRRE